jgi:hypothetical protein
MEKTTYQTVRQVETISVLPRTIEIVPEQMKLPEGIGATMHVVYGYDPAQRKVWLATFIDDEEAQAWVQGSKTFGRPVRGAVVAGQDKVTEATTVAEASDGSLAVGNEDTGPVGPAN